MKYHEGSTFSEQGNSEVQSCPIELHSELCNLQLYSDQELRSLHCTAEARLPTVLMATSWAFANWRFFFWIPTLCIQAGTLYEKQMVDRTKRCLHRFLALSGQRRDGFTFPGRLWNPLATLFLSCKMEEKDRNESGMFNVQMSGSLICICGDDLLFCFVFSILH